jgi:uncharacterized protein (DUF1501 family)
MGRKQSRREFIKWSALGSSALFVPGFLKAIPFNDIESSDGNILVIIQLAGGNDGLNTIVPYRNDIYYKLRPQISIPAKEVISITDELGLNPSMKSFAGLFDQGDVTILNNVGYPNPNRSHFRSTDIWQSGSAADDYVHSGWIGRYLDKQLNQQMHHAIELNSGLSLAMKGEKTSGMAFADLKSFYQSTTSPFIKGLQYPDENAGTSNGQVQFLYSTLIETRKSAEYLHQHAKPYSSRSKFPNHMFGKQLKTIAQMIVSGSNTKVYFLTLAGFDTHAGQKGIQNRLLKIYSDGLSTFAKDLKDNGKWNNTLIMSFSEFGRRVAQNGSAGTDHGTANNLHLLGGKLKKPGIFNEAPDLENAIDGDLKHSIDFRQVYATVLEKWLNEKNDVISGVSGEMLPFI